MGLFLRKAPRLLHDHHYPPGSSGYVIRAAQNGYIKIVCNPIKMGLLQIVWVKISPKISNSPLF